MKIKSLLAILLALVLCLSGALVSCTPNNNDDPKINTDPENDKKVISDQLSEGSLEDLFEQLESQETQLDLSDIYAEIAKIEFSAELDLDTEWIDTILSLSMKDGIIEAEVTDEKAYIVIGEDLSMTMLSQFGNGYWVESEEMIPSDMNTEITEESLVDMLGVSEEVLDIVKGFSFPEIDEDDIELDGDWYVISDEYCEDVAKAVLDLIVDISEAEGEGPTDEEYDEALDQITDVIDALGLEIGFAVVGENIVGIMTSVDVDIEEMYEITGGEMSEDDKKLEASIEIWATNDALFLSSIEISLDIEMQDVLVDGSLSYEYGYENGMLSKMSFEADVEYAEGDDEPSTVKGEFSCELIYDGADICGLAVDADMSMTNIEIGGDYYETAADEYGEYVTCVGDVEIDASLLIDTSKLSKEGEKVVNINADFSSTGKSMYYEIYDYETYEYETSTDMSIFVDAPKASDFDAAVEINGAATVASENEIDVDFKVSIDGETPVDISGTLDLENTSDIVLPVNADGLAEAYASISESAEDLALVIEEMFDYSSLLPIDGYYIHDSESGLYAYISQYGYVEHIGTVSPTDEEFVDYYGTYIGYGE